VEGGLLNFGRENVWKEAVVCRLAECRNLQEGHVTVAAIPEEIQSDHFPHIKGQYDGV
jgi:hypothetical protein